MGDPFVGLPFLLNSDMAFPNALVSTELDAVNQILGAVGQAPVTTLNDTNPDVAIAYDTLQEVNREVQAEGWGFNTETEYPFTPNTGGEILIPSNVLLLDLSDLYENKGYQVVRRNGKLYNKIDHTFTWTSTLKCDVVWLFDFVDLPLPARDYIVARASVQASSKMVGDPAIFQMLQQKEALSRANLLEYDCNQGDYSFFGHPRGNDFYVSYQPFKTLAR
jgi:hypothetical protein